MFNEQNSTDGIVDHAEGLDENNQMLNTENSQDILDEDKFKKNGAKRGKRKSNDASKDTYIQEPQYVTKLTSRGRLVKMKINTDYDYTSDQELEAKKKKSKLNFYWSNNTK